MGDVLCTIGINVPVLLAGFSGGMVRSFFMKTAEPWPVMGAIFAGGVTANYLSPSIGWFLGTSALTSAFAVGLCGMGICKKIIESASYLSPFKDTKNE